MKNNEKFPLAGTHKWINSIICNYIQTDWHSPGKLLRFFAIKKSHFFHFSSLTTPWYLYFIFVIYTPKMTPPTSTQCFRRQFFFSFTFCMIFHSSNWWVVYVCVYVLWMFLFFCKCKATHNIFLFSLLELSIILWFERRSVKKCNIPFFTETMRCLCVYNYIP